MPEPDNLSPVSAEQFVAILRGETTIDAITEQRKLKRFRRRSGRLQNQFEAVLREMPDSKLQQARRHWAVAWSAVSKVYPFEFGITEGSAYVRALHWAIKRVCEERPAVVERVKRNRTTRREAAKTNRGQGKAKNR